MKNIAENNLIRFINVTKKKDGIFANFKAKGIRGGLSFGASFSVDISATEADPTVPLEKIIEDCARLVVKEFRKTELEFEGIPSAI